MGWTVRFDKPDFIGRGGLIGVRERGLRNKLVGFVMQDGRVPDDGDPVVVGSNPIGRVTSARLSPTIGKGFGLAWVPVEMAQEGSKIEIFIDGKSWPAEVTLQPIYDPDGARLRGGS
jgi:aminomethyltransferase